MIIIGFRILIRILVIFVLVILLLLLLLLFGEKVRKKWSATLEANIWYTFRGGIIMISIVVVIGIFFIVIVIIISIVVGDRGHTHLPCHQ